MKSDERGDAMSRPSQRSSFLGDPSRKIFLWRTGPQAKTRGGSSPAKKTGRGLLFCFSSLAEPVAAARSGQGRARILGAAAADP
jgi:hypothetical protein